MRKRMILPIAGVTLLVAAVIICAVIFAPKPVQESVLVEAAVSRFRWSSF